jgi:hypothetical protein
MPSGRYQGRNCKRTTGGSGVPVRIGVLPLLEKLLCFAQQYLVFACVSRAFNRRIYGGQNDRIVWTVPVAGEDRGRPCWLRTASEYKQLVPATLIGGQPSQGTASASADRGSWG